MLFHINRPDSITCLRGQHTSDIMGLQWSVGGVGEVGCVLASWDATGLVVLWGCGGTNCIPSFHPIATFHVPEIATLVWARNEDAVLWSCAAAAAPCSEAAAACDAAAAAAAAAGSSPTVAGGALLQCSRCVHTLLCCITVTGEAVLIGDDGWAPDCSRYAQLRRLRLWSFHRASAVVASVIPVPVTNRSSVTAVAAQSSDLSGESLQELCNFSIFCSIGTTLLHHRLTVTCSWGGQRACISTVARVVAASSLCPSTTTPPSALQSGKAGATHADLNDYGTAAGSRNSDEPLFDSGSSGAPGCPAVLSLLLSPCCSELFVSVRRRDSSVYLLRFLSSGGTKPAEVFELVSSRLIIRNDSGSSLVVLPILGDGGGIMIRHACGLSIVSRDLLRNVAAGALPLSALRIASASAPGDDVNCSSSGAPCSFGAGSACASPGGFLVILTTSNLSCAVLSLLHCVTPHPVSSVMRYCVAASLARLRSVADAMIAFSTLVALLPKVISAQKIQEWVLTFARSFGSMSRDTEAQRIIQGHMIHMMCQCDFFSMKSRQHINAMLCQRMEYILKNWRDSAQVLTQAVPEAVLHNPSMRSWPSGCGREWILLVMLRLVAMHHVLRYMALCFEANLQDVRHLRETPDGQQRFATMQQVLNTMRNMLSTPSKDIYTFLNTYSPIMSGLAALHAESSSDHINHPVVASLHRDVSELLTGASEVSAKFSSQPSNLQLELQALVKRRLRPRSSASLTANATSPASATPPKAAGTGSNSVSHASTVNAAPAAAEPDGVSRNISSPPPPAGTTANPGIREDSPEFASACLRCASPAAYCNIPYCHGALVSFLALDRPYGGVIDWYVAPPRESDAIAI